MSFLNNCKDNDLFFDMPMECEEIPVPKLEDSCENVGELEHGLFFTDMNTIDIKGKNIVITGACPPISQERMEDYITFLGGNITFRVVCETDIILVGNKSCDYHLYGNKMIDTMIVRERYGSPALVKLSSFLNAYPLLDNLENYREFLLSRCDEFEKELFYTYIAGRTFDKFDDINFNGKSVCITDALYSGISRSSIIKFFESMGATTTSNVNKKTNVLVLGENYSAINHSSTFFKKLESGLSQKNMRDDFYIILETEFVKKFLVSYNSETLTN